MVRPSGTEPVVKLYAEVVRPVRSSGELAAVRAEAAGYAERLLAAAAAALEADAPGPEAAPGPVTKGDQS
jgi:hypothetical protein